jgi:signal transduction histidine kinase
VALAINALGQAGTNTELRSVAAVRHLSLDQTRQKIPVRLHGVITFFDERLYSRFFQDETAGIYLQFPTNVAPPPFYAGLTVDVTGTSSPGEYAPVVMVDKIVASGQGTMPAPASVDYNRLASGVEDSQFIEITGVVRSARLLEDSQYYLIELATGSGRLLVYSRELPVKKTDDFLDSTVLVRGVCSTKFNHQRQLFAIRVMVPTPKDIEVKASPPVDPFAIAAHPIGSLLQFTPQQTYAHRVKVIGTVTSQSPGQNLYLQDGEHGLKIQTAQRTPLHLGDRVEALGFVSQGEYTPLLQDAVYRVVSPGFAPASIPLSPDEVLKGNHDCRLITVTGRILDRTEHGSEQDLILQEGSYLFHALLNQPFNRDAFAKLENGSRVAVTGICQIDPGEWEAGEAWRAKAFSVQLRTITDVMLLNAPPWWTLQKVLWMAVALGFAMLAAFAWVAVLHRQVAERTRQLEIQSQGRQKAERRREIEQERARVAHDLHDELGAGLTEVNMLAWLVKSATTSAEEKEKYLDDLAESARRMVTSLDEIVWAVNSKNDTISSLASYFASYAQRMLDLAGITCGLDIAAELPEHPLDPSFRQEIFFAFKEALTNIVRHAQATQVWVRIAVHEQGLMVELTDNGRGFDQSGRQAGSDGLDNMRARLKKAGGECIIDSRAKKGTVVQFFAPLPDRVL